jgi:hypothetical protein
MQARPGLVSQGRKTRETAKKGHDKREFWSPNVIGAETTGSPAVTELEKALRRACISAAGISVASYPSESSPNCSPAWRRSSLQTRSRRFRILAGGYTFDSANADPGYLET